MGFHRALDLFLVFMNYFFALFDIRVCKYFAFFSEVENGLYQGPFSKIQSGERLLKTKKYSKNLQKRFNMFRLGLMVNVWYLTNISLISHKKLYQYRLVISVVSFNSWGLTTYPYYSIYISLVTVNLTHHLTV